MRGLEIPCVPHQGSHPFPSLSSPQDFFLWTSRLQAQLRERVFNTVLCNLRDQPHWSIPGHVTQMSLPLRLLPAGPQSCEWLETQKMEEAGRHPAGWFLQPRCCRAYFGPRGEGLSPATRAVCSDCPPLSPGPKQDSEAAKKFILDMYTGMYAGCVDSADGGRKGSRSRRLFSHYTCATDTQNIRKVFKDVRDSVLARYLDEINLL